MSQIDIFLIFGVIYRRFSQLIISTHKKLKHFQVERKSVMNIWIYTIETSVEKLLI